MQVGLPTLTAQNLEANDEDQILHRTCQFWNFIPFFNSKAKVAVKLHYWQGKDSLKAKSKQRQKPGPKRKMRLTDEFLLIMMTPRLVLSERDLADRFCVSTSTVSPTLITWHTLLANCLRHLIAWPSRDVTYCHNILKNSLTLE